MKIRKYCKCGVKLEREVADEEAARQVVAVFRREHSGTGHGPTDFKGYCEAVRKVIIANVRRKEDQMRGRSAASRS